MTLAEFVRLFPLRAKNVAWFFGAGTSVSAGLPTAGDLVWEFKRMIYCSEQGYQLSLFENQSDPALRKQIQSYFDSKGSFPKEGSVEEYSLYFELAFPSARDRSDYLMQRLNSMQNSFGHKVIGTLMKNDLIRLVFTSNFDKAFENAAVEQFKTMNNFFVATTDNTVTAVQKYHSGLRPFIAKIHGDYFSEKLKNTTEELKTQDAQLRDILYHSCLSNGIAVMGYSGRDESVMEVLNKALETSTAFPNGIFWFIRPGSKPLAVVNSFLEKAKQKGIQAELIEIETFDTAWGDIAKGITSLPAEEVAKFNVNYFRRTSVTLPNKGKRFPLIRFNAVSITELPVNARLIKCNAGGTREIIEQIENSRSNIIAIRKQDGIVGFGEDKEFEKVFSLYAPLEKDIYQIPDNTVVKEDSTLKGLLTEALVKALVKDKPLIPRKRKNRYLVIPDPKRIDDPMFAGFKNELGQLTGIIPGTKIHWIISMEVSLQKKFSSYFMVINPTILAGKTDVDNERYIIAAFVKEFMARWYNNKYAQFLDFWLDVIFPANVREVTLFAYDKNITGFNAKYILKRDAPTTQLI